MHENFDHIFAHAKVSGGIVVYCEHRKNKNNNYNAKIKQKPYGHIITSGAHGTECSMRMKTTESGVDDCTSITKSIVDNASHKNQNCTPRRICLELKQELDKKYSTWIGVSDMQVMNRVNHLRYQPLGKDALLRIEEPNAGKTKDYKFWFLQFNMAAPNPDANEFERIDRFGNLELFLLLHGKPEMCADGIFFCMPFLFKQVAVMMACDAQYISNVLILNVLVVGKNTKINSLPFFSTYLHF